MMRICMVVQNYYDIDPRVRREAEGLIEKGHSVDVISLRMREREEKEYDLNDVHVYTIPLEKNRRGISQYIFEYIQFFLWAFVVVTFRNFRYKYQVIQIHTLPDFLVFSAIIPKLMGAKIILDMHEIMPEFYICKFGTKEEHWIIKLIKIQEKISFHFADRVIVINEPIKELLNSRGLNSDKMTVVMNSVDKKLFAENENQNNNSSNEPFVFIYHGTLTYIYGLDIVLKAFAIVHEKMQNTQLWIIGDGPEREKLEALADRLGIDDKVYFIGLIPQQDIPKWLSQSSVGVLATRQDLFLDYSFSNKLPEYIIMKKPVIMSRLKTISYYFSEEALAFFTPHDEVELAEQMQSLQYNQARREELVEHALAEYCQFDWDVMKDRFLSIFEAL